MKYEIWKATDGNWYWHLKAGNNEIIATGEGYTTKQSVLHVIQMVATSGDAKVYNLSE